MTLSSGKRHISNLILSVNILYDLATYAGKRDRTIVGRILLMEVTSALRPSQKVLCLSLMTAW